MWEWGQYSSFLDSLIPHDKAGWPVPWFTAQATYHNSGDPADAEFRAAMKQLWDQETSREGPDTDALREEYRSGVHFNGKGQREHGRLWAEKVGHYLDKEVGTPTRPAIAQAETIHFNPTIQSLKQYSVPEWFEDAKLGIWGTRLNGRTLSDGYRVVCPVHV